MTHYRWEDVKRELNAKHALEAKIRLYALVCIAIHMAALAVVSTTLILVLT